MDSTMIDFGWFQIKWYSFFILIAMGIACLLIWREAKKKKASEDYITDVLFYGILISILGARIYYVLFNLSYYLKHPLESLMIWNGGLAIHGGIIAFLVFLYFYSKKYKKNYLLTLDIIAPAVLIAQAIGRWGNFFNQEAYGRVVSLEFLQGMHLPKWMIDNMLIGGQYREPTFLYESILSILGFIILILIRKNKEIKTGQLTGIYMVWYGIERCIIETFRSDSLMLGPIKIAQLISIILIVVGTYLLTKNSKREKNYFKDTIEK